MIECPRCNIEQNDSPLCEYCGLVFSEHRRSARTSKASNPKRIALLAVILVISGALVVSYWLASPRSQPDPESTIVEGSSTPVQRSKDKDLQAAAKELSGDIGIVDQLTGGSTKGSVVAMVVFSIIGLGYLSYGKKSQQLMMVICGIGLMGYSYFAGGTLYIILIGLILSILPFVLVRN
jgi:hypothetical protein